LLGTNRSESMTRRVGGIVAKIYAELHEPLQVLDLADLPPRLFRSESYVRPPISFRPWSDAVVAARGLIIVTPEYNGGMPGALKYFIDLLPFPQAFERKPVCFIGLAAGQWGALRPVEQLQQVCLYRSAYLYPDRVLLPNVGNLFAGPTLTDGDIRSRLVRQADGFRSFCRQLTTAAVS
jgi:NAD(P)H-dependent FMN reductase